jgi:RNA polymerase sigma factor (TIGR02999 family)
MSDVTQILTAAASGDPNAAAQLLPLFYDELRKLALARMAAEKPGQTLQATALIHEAYLRLVGSERDQAWNGRTHFFGAAAEAMRRILVDSARRKNRIRHGGDRKRLTFDDLDVPAETTDEDVLALSEALDHLSVINPRAAELIKLRYYAGLTGREAAEVLSISPRKADQIWAYARAWLYDRLNGKPG